MTPITQMKTNRVSDSSSNKTNSNDSDFKMLNLQSMLRCIFRQCTILMTCSSIRAKDCFQACEPIRTDLFFVTISFAHFAFESNRIQNSHLFRTFASTMHFAMLFLCVRHGCAFKCPIRNIIDVFCVIFSFIR